MRRILERWTDDRVAELKRRWAEGDKASHIARALGGVTRNGVLGKVFRLGLSKPFRPADPVESEKKYKARLARKNGRLKAQRWAKNPSLAQRAQVRKMRDAQELKRNRAMFAATGTAKTSASYRRHMPYMPEMTKDQLRAMLRQAVVNTAGMQ